MTAFSRILGIALCLSLLSGSDALGAGKRQKPNGRSRGKPAAGHVNHTIPAKTPPTSGPEAAAGKSTPTQLPERTGEGRAAPVRESVRQESRIEFDERMLRGQSAAGVIYLFQRTPSDWKSIVEVPGSFRSRTVSVLGPAEEKK